MSIAFQVDQKIVVAGPAAFQGDASFVIRLSPSGVLDVSFGTGGVELVPVIATSIAALPAGKILIAGISSAGLGTVERLNADGSLDSSFGTGGSITTSVGASVIMVQPDGKIVVGGDVVLPLLPHQRFASVAFAVARYLATGAPDGTFGQGGTVATTTLGSVTTLGLETDGSILALAGQNLGGANPAVLRFTASGASESVGVSGAVSPIAVTNTMPSLTLRANGDIIASGAAPGIGKHGRFGRLNRYTLPGVLDPNFGVVFNWGIAAPNVENGALAVAIAPDGKIVAGGVAFTSTFPHYEFGFGEFNSDGTLDTAFASGGLTETEIAGEDEAFAVAVQPDGKPVAAGFETLSNSGQIQLCLARYLAP